MVETKLKDYLAGYSEQWMDSLPEGAPPEVVLVPNNDVFYRITLGNSLTNEDLISYLQKWPEKYQGEAKIFASGVSVFDDLNAAKRKMKLPALRNHKGIAKLTLYPADGVVKKSFGKYHYTWWRTQSFDLSKAEMETL